MKLKPYFIVQRTDDSIVWAGFCCCRQHAIARAEIRAQRCLDREAYILGPISPEHPLRRAAAS